MRQRLEARWALYLRRLVDRLRVGEELVDLMLQVGIRLDIRLLGRFERLARRLKSFELFDILLYVNIGLKIS